MRNYIDLFYLVLGAVLMFDFSVSVADYNESFPLHLMVYTTLIIASFFLFKSIECWIVNQNRR